MKDSSTLLSKMQITRGWLGVLSLLCVFSIGSLQAATWQGSSGDDWVSDNWGLSGGGSPGDANFPAEDASIETAGTIIIKAGDSITMSGDISPSSSIASEIHQTGGTVSTTGRIYVRTNYTLSGGSLTVTNDTRIQEGGIFIVNGGTFSSSSRIQFLAGVSTLEISGGAFTGSLQQIRADGAGITNATVRVIGSNPTALNVKSMKLQNTDVNANVLADFVFDASGVTPWTITGGGNSLDLGNTGDGSAASLAVNVSARQGDGVTGVNLFDYSNFQAGSTFGAISITDTTYGTLALGTQGALTAGQYFLDYGDYSLDSVTLYYNTVPEPGSLTLTVAGLMALGLLLRRRRGTPQAT